MQPEYLVQMANDVSAFFAPDREVALAAAAVAHHLKRYWDPRMRRQIVECLDTDDASALTPVARAGIEILAAESRPKSPA
jgi:formate dehydrogenase subunit delta